MKSAFVSATVLWLVLVVLLCLTTSFSQNSRQVINTYADLPTHRYSVTKSFLNLRERTDTTDNLLNNIRNDIRHDLDTYTIQDQTTLKKLLNGLVDIAMILKEDSVAVGYIPTIAELETKTAAKVLAGLLTRCVVLAEQDGPGGSDGRKDSAVAAELYSSILAMDWDLVQNDIKQMKGRLEFANDGFFQGMADSRYGPFLEQNAELSGELLLDVIQMKAFVSRILPYKAVIVATLDNVISAASVEKENIWVEREIDITGKQETHPVIIGIWDTGVDPDAFPDNMHKRNSELVDGFDNDGNGFIDDVYGIAYSYHAHREVGVLLSLQDDERETVMSFEQHLKGGMDSRAGVDSDESKALKEFIGGMKPEEVGPFMENFMHYVHYVHGTHIAGIAVAGNPQARILVARLSLPYQNVPEPLLKEDVEREAASYRETVDYFREEGVRVVCMSWDLREDFYERILEVHGIGKDQDDRRRMGRELFEIALNGMREAMQNVPEILFVVAAGNFDNDIDFEKMLPASIELPNVMSVGAVDMAGDETSFTSFGSGVDVFANGYMIESRIPGGKTMALSGTSQAAPQVANLAAKLLAVEPTLTTAEVVDLIKAGSAPKEGGRALLINPKESFRLLRERLDK